MFENLSPLGASEGRRGGLSLEALEDRATPAVVGAAGDQFGGTGFATTGVAALLNGVTVGQSAVADRAFLAEVGRVSAMQTFIADVAAAQGANGQVREYARQLAAYNRAIFEQVQPALARSGVTFQFTPIDVQVARTLPTLSGADLDNQFLFLSSLYGLQANGLARSATFLTGNPALRAFAQAQLTGIQGQLQTGFGLLGPDAANQAFGAFNTLGGFGPLGSLGLGNTGFANTGLGLAGFGSTGFGSTGFGATFGTPTFGTAGFGTGAGFGTSGTFNTFGGFGTGAGTGFGPAATFGSTGTATGFGPANTTGGFNTGTFGTGTFGTAGTGTPVF